MHALTILQRCVAPLLAGIHRRRLSVLLEAVAATVSGPRLTLTEIGRRFGGGSNLRHRIKRADRLLGNVHLQHDAKHIYKALARMLLSGVAEPLIVIDWSDLKEDQSLHLLRASVPVGGRSLTLYEEVHTQSNLGNRRVQHRFLGQLKALLPATADPIIVADSGFKVPFYREVERLGWRWVGRVRGRDYIKLKHRWRSCKNIFKEATTTPTALGMGEWVRSNPLRAAFVLVRKPKLGRRAKTASGQRSRSKKSQQAARNAREPWLLVASTRLADWPAKRLVKVYRQSVQIELFFKILKSGCQIEELQLERRARLEPAIAFYLIIAWRVLFLTQLGRDCPELPCGVVFDEAEWRAVYLVTQRKPPPKQPPPLDTMVRMVATLGGFLNRKGDGFPGSKTLWIGLQRAADFVIALEAQRSVSGSYG